MSSSVDCLACTSVVPAGAQTYSMDVADASGTRAAYCSTLALYIYDIAAQPRLETILTASDRTILSMAWSPHDANVIAMATAEDNHNVHLWDVGAQVVTRQLSANGQAKIIQWSPMLPGELVTASLFGAIHRLFTLSHSDSHSAFTQAQPVDWYSREGKTGRKESETPRESTPRITSFRVSARIESRYALTFENGLVHVLTDRSCTMDMAHKGEVIADCQWDPLSEQYLLVGCRSGNIYMYDVDAKTQIQTFDPSPGGLQALAWVPGVPGDFVTVSGQTGVLRVWNVSNRKHKDSLKAEAGPFHGLSFMMSSQRALCRFKSGAVGILDLSKRTWSMFGRAAHTDTVFGAAFKPADANILATCSFDGSIRLWDTKEATLQRELVGEDLGVLYALAWAPEDPTRLVAVSSKGEALVWDVEAAVLEKRVPMFSSRESREKKTNVYACDWAPSKIGGVIACAGEEGVYIIDPTAGSLILKIKTLGHSTFGVSWNMFNGLLASSCADGLIRLHTITLPSGPGRPANASDTSLKGHTAKIFGVAWSPLLPDVLLSGSDDKTVRVWDTRSGTHRTLIGHTQNVRALHWSYEVPWLAFSGAWDGTIRVWDTRSCTAIQVITDHRADVYSIVSHPHRPGVILSTSRDTTIRTWGMDAAFTPIMLPLILGATSASPHARHSLFAALLQGDVQAEVASLARLPQACCGTGARALAERLSQTASANGSPLELLSLIFDFFHPPRGMENLWALLNWIRVGDEHGSHEVRSADAVLTSARGQLSLLMADKDSSKSKMVGEGANRRRVKQEDRLRMAATLSLHLGEMEQYCELMVMLGEWTHAIAIAPSVSIAYWRQLCSRHAAELVGSSAESVTTAPLMIGSGDHRGAVEYMMGRNEHLDAQTLASSLAAGLLPVPADDSLLADGAAAQGGGGKDSTLLVNVFSARALAYGGSGEPVLAACCSLAQGQASSAMAELLRSHQLELALALALTLNLPALPLLLRMLSSRAERLHDWPLALQLLQRTRDPASLISLLAARCAHAPSTLDAPVDLFAIASLPPAASYRQLGETAQRGGNVAEAVRCYIVAGDVPTACALALPVLKAAMGDGACDMAAAQSMLEPLRQACMEPASGASAAVLAWSAYEATLQAMWRGYTPVLVPLHRAVGDLCAIAAAEPHVPTEADLDALSLQVYAYMLRSHAGPSSAAALGDSLDEKLKLGLLAPPLAKALANLQSAAPPAEPPLVNTKPTVVRAAALPASGGGLSRRAVDQASRSYFDGAIVQGPVFPVSAGGRDEVIPLSEAIMWAKLHPFSPSHSGERLNPF